MEDGKLTKDQLKGHLLKIVVGKDRSPDDSWRLGERADVLEEATDEDIHQAKVVVHEVF